MRSIAYTMILTSLPAMTFNNAVSLHSSSQHDALALKQPLNKLNPNKIKPHRHPKYMYSKGEGQTRPIAFLGS